MCLYREVGADHLVSNDLRERRVACVCVRARAHMRGCGAGARVDADNCVPELECPDWARVCSGDARPRACAHPSRLLLHLPTPPPSTHPSIRQSVCLSRIRPSVPVRSIVFPIPKEGAKNQLSFIWAAGTQSSPDGGSQRFTHLPADTARLGRKGGALLPSWSPPPSEGPSRSLLPSVPRGVPLSRTLDPAFSSYFALLLGRPSRPSAPNVEISYPPHPCLAFSFEGKTWET